MIIDLILDRKDGAEYNAKRFYNNCMSYNTTFKGIADEITRAMDEGTEEDVKYELCKYIFNNNYNMEICKYINSVKWLQ